MEIDSFRNDESIKKVSKFHTLCRVLSNLIQYKARVVRIILIIFLTSAISIVNPIIIECAIDNYIRKENLKGLEYLVLFSLLINLAFLLLLRMRILIVGRLTNKILKDIRSELFIHMQKLSFGYFDRKSSGKILSRIIGDVNTLKDIFDSFITTLVPDIVTFLGMAIVMVWKNWKMTLAGLAVMPMLIVVVWGVQRISHLRWQDYLFKSANLNAFIHEEISGMNVIQSFQAENEMKKIFAHLVDNHQKVYLAAVRCSSMFGSTVEICRGISMALVYLAGVMLISKGMLTLGSLVAFSIYMGMMWNPIMTLSNFYNQTLADLAAVERIYDLLDTKPDIKDQVGAIHLYDVKGDICFKNVSFRYESDNIENQNVLNDISFHIAEGETIALVGPTGAGKTTIINLICRFYEAQKGNIYIDEHDITKISLSSLRHQIGIMTQDNFIFQGTIRDNIAYGKLDANDQEIYMAAKAVKIHDTILEMEDGYNTTLKEQGAGLSKGLRQLISFARIMLSRPNIIILDEATSNIDMQTEMLIQESIDTLIEDRTSIIIAHRLSTIKKADRIFIIDKGKIVEQGNLNELVSNKGYYFSNYLE